MGVVKEIVDAGEPRTAAQLAESTGANKLLIGTYSLLETQLGA